MTSIVVIKKYPFLVLNSKIFPKERDEEIKACKNKKTRNEKYYVWMLLQNSLKKYFGIDIKNTDIKKEKSGKWTSSMFNFSLSHSKNLVAVGISLKEKIGIDIQERKTVDIERMIKNDNDIDVENDVLLSIKEAIFKTRNEENFIPKNIETKKEKFELFDIISNKEEYILSIKCDEDFRLICGCCTKSSVRK